MASVKNNFKRDDSSFNVFHFSSAILSLSISIRIKSTRRKQISTLRGLFSKYPKKKGRKTLKKSEETFDNSIIALASW